MDFFGFMNEDFDFLKRKASMTKPEYDEKKEDVKRRFREFCYQIQKSYHISTGGTLLLDKDFQGLNKNKEGVTARCRVDGNSLLGLKISLDPDNISINLICPSDGSYQKIEKFKDILINSKEILSSYFKENKTAFLVLYRIDHKKSAEGVWTEEFKFSNREMCLDDYHVLTDNLEKLQPRTYDPKKIAGVSIRVQFSRGDIIRSGKTLPSRTCTEIIKLLNLSQKINDAAGRKS